MTVRYHTRIKLIFLTKSPDCQDYLKAQVEPSFQILQDENVVRLTIVPFGNAEIDTTKETVLCQHGLGECDANSYEQCMISLVPSPSEYLPILFCVESKLPPGRKDEKFDPAIFSECSSTDFDLIQACHDNPVISWVLQVEASKLTPSYHNAVPWVEIDGEHIDEENINLAEEICNAYLAKGGSSPHCTQLINKRRYFDIDGISMSQ